MLRTHPKFRPKTIFENHTCVLIVAYYVCAYSTYTGINIEPIKLEQQYIFTLKFYCVEIQFAVLS